MLVFQAFPLSFSIFWRFALALPIILIGLFLYGFAGGFISFILGLVFPPLAFFVSFLIGASSGVIPAMIGARFGLQACGIKPKSKYHAMIVPAIAYGAVEGITATICAALAVGLFLLLASFNSTNLALLAENPDLAAELWDPALTLPVVAAAAVFFLGICAIRAGLLVPIASGSIGRDPDDRPYTPFRHFGASFFPIFILVIVSYVGLIFIYALATIAVFATGFVTQLQEDAVELTGMINGYNPIRPIWSFIGLFIANMLIGFWAFSLQSAGGALGFLKLREELGTSPQFETLQSDEQQSPAVTPTGPRLSSEELRALRKSRETGHH